MAIKRMIEVWDKGSDGAFLGRIELAPGLPTPLLRELFRDEQDHPDPEMLASYWLDEAKCAALQPYSADALEPERYDYILSVTRVG